MSLPGKRRRSASILGPGKPSHAKQSSTEALLAGTLLKAPHPSVCSEVTAGTRQGQEFLHPMELGKAADQSV